MLLALAHWFVPPFEDVFDLDPVPSPADDLDAEPSDDFDADALVSASFWPAWACEVAHRQAAHRLDGADAPDVVEGPRWPVLGRPNPPPPESGVPWWVVVVGLVVIAAGLAGVV